MPRLQIEAPRATFSALEPTRRPHDRRGHELPFEVVERKIGAPALQLGLISRTALVNRLRAQTAARLVTVTAPAGYGKTTLLAQWAAREARDSAWVSVDEHDSKPLVLLRHVAAALDAGTALGSRTLDALASPKSSLWSAALPRLAGALAEGPPRVLFLDDADLARSSESVELLSVLADHMPAGGVLVLAGRTTPQLPIPALRASGTLLEVGVEQLAFAPREARRVLRAAGADVAFEEVTALVRACEGWPVAVDRAARCLRDHGRRPDAKAPDELVARELTAYLRAQYLSRLLPGLRQFLRRTSVVDELCGSLCDALLGRTGSARELELIERSNLFLVPLDRQRMWFRYHRLFRQALQDELEVTEPKLVRELHRRAADWYAARRDWESALHHAYAQGDRRRAVRIFARIALPLYHEGDAAVVDGWLARFDDARLLKRYPTLALRGSWIHAMRGRRADAQRWLELAEPSSDDVAERQLTVDQHASSLVIRAAFCADDVARMATDAEASLAALGRDHPLRPAALVVLGVASMLLGRSERADAILLQGAAEADRAGAADINALAVAERSLLASAQTDHAGAEELALQAHALARRCGVESHPAAALALCVAARPLLRQGRADEARADLAQVRRLLLSVGPGLFPWLALQTRLELACAHLALRETEVVRTLIAEIRELIGESPSLGLAADEADAVEAALGAVCAEEHAGAGLTSAELRLLPLLATHLSFREIGEQLYVSRNTIKTQAISVYRKLGVTSRSDAITSAATLGLIGPAAIGADR